VFTCILASSRITQSGSWKTDPSFLRGFCHSQCVTRKGKLKSIKNMIYLLLRRIDSRLWDNRLMQILKIDQSIDHPHKILRVSGLGFSWGVCSPLLEAFSISIYKEGMTIKQYHVIKEEEFKERIQTRLMFEASWSIEDGTTSFWTLLIVTLLTLTWAQGAMAWGTRFHLKANFEQLGWRSSMIFDIGVHSCGRRLQECHTPFRDSGNEASICVPRMFHSHV
jgi:hypothetical protein